MLVKHYEIRIYRLRNETEELMQVVHALATPEAAYEALHDIHTRWSKEYRADLVDYDQEAVLPLEHALRVIKALGTVE